MVRLLAVGFHGMKAVCVTGRAEGVVLRRRQSRSLRDAEIIDCCSWMTAT